MKLSEQLRGSGLAIEADIAAKLEAKAAKWDKLDMAIAKFYPEDEDEEGGDLVDIGEVAARAFGYL